MNFQTRPTAKTSVNYDKSIVPFVYIADNALNKMFLYVDECKDEIGWLGTATYNAPTHSYTIEDVFLFKQDVHSTTTEITPEGLEQFATELLKQENGIEIWNNIRVWGHSHVNMDISPSGQDDKQMREFGQNGQEWFLRIIANKRGELSVDVYDYVRGLFFDNVPWEISANEHTSDPVEAMRNQIAKMQAELSQVIQNRVHELKGTIVQEMKEKVNKIVYKVTPNKQAHNPYLAPQKHNLNPTPKKKNTINVLENKQDVFNFFSDNDLHELTLCRTLYELSDELYEYGYYNFTDEDERLIWDVVQSYTYDEWHGGVY